MDTYSAPRPARPRPVALSYDKTVTNDVTDLKRENGELKARVEELEHQLDLIKGHLGI